uniref:Protein kinase domain-containing protein n=1 Tax=Panagrellus redivivus TaxID=6233 RepID=A0A7E4W2Y2_PANRE
MQSPGTPVGDPRADTMSNMRSPSQPTSPSNGKSPVDTTKTTHRNLQINIAVESLVSDIGMTYTIERAIGKGGYGIVYAVFDADMNYFALKTERSSAVATEIAVLKATAANKCNHFAKLHDKGYSEALKQGFIVMDILGPSLSEIKNLCDDHRLTPPTALRVAMQTLNAIEEIHECNYISRDVKPSNFVTSAKPGHCSLIYMIDFGIAKRYRDELTGEIIPERVKGGFRGTARYCSINNHYKKDQSRRDDVESWLYLCSELFNGRLLWHKLGRGERTQILEYKKSARNVNLIPFLGNLPKKFGTVMRSNDRLRFSGRPDYAMAYAVLEAELTILEIPYDAPYDWENFALFSTQPPSTSTPPHSSKTQSTPQRSDPVVDTQEET